MKTSTGGSLPSLRSHRVGNRYYDPELGRFITADPMGYVDGPSMYQFAGYSPVNFGDPLGLETEIHIAGVHVFTVPDWAEAMIEEHVGKMAGMAAETAELVLASQQVSNAGFGDPFSGMIVLGAQQAWEGYQHGREMGERIRHARDHGAPGDYEAEVDAVKAEFKAMAAERVMSLPIFQTVEGIYQTREQTTAFEKGYWEGRTAFRFMEDASLVFGLWAAAHPPEVGVSLAQGRALARMGVDRAGRRAFFEGKPVAFQHSTVGGEPTQGFIQLRGGSLRAVILNVKDLSGEGARAFFSFRGRARNIARTLGLQELELGGGLIVKEEIGVMLNRRGFRPQTAVVPEELGGPRIKILSKTEKLRD